MSNISLYGSNIYIYLLNRDNYNKENYEELSTPF